MKNGSELLRYCGAISYDSLRTGSVVRRFDFIDSKTVLFEFVSAADRQLTTRLVGVAELYAERAYRSPWIRLTREDGNALGIDVEARIEFTVQDHNEFEVRIEGQWSYVDSTFSFGGFLQARGI